MAAGEYCNDIAVAEARNDLCFFDEALIETRIPTQIETHRLESDLALEIVIDGKPDVCHATGTDVPGEFIARDGRQRAFLLHDYRRIGIYIRAAAAF